MKQRFDQLAATQEDRQVKLERKLSEQASLISSAQSGMEDKLHSLEERIHTLKEEEEQRREALETLGAERMLAAGGGTVPVQQISLHLEHQLRIP